MPQEMLCCGLSAVSENTVQTKDAFDAETLWKNGNVYEEYTFIDLIGKGGNATVWKAQHKETKAFVAVKISENTRDSCNALMKEFSVLQKIKSPYVISPRHFFYGRNRSSFMVTDMFSSDLFALIEESGRLNDDALRTILKDIGAAIRIVHEKDLVHRDIKSENIFVTEGGTLVLGDFGAVEHEDAMTLHVPVGTISYLAPELLVGIADRNTFTFAIGKPIDIFALGLTLYFAATGEHLIPAELTIRQMVRFYDEIDMSAKILSLDKDESFKELLSGMLDYSPVRRLTIKEVLKHPFVTSRDKYHI